MSRFFLSALILFSLTACITTRSNHGYILERGEESLSAEVGVDTKDSILARYGEPSIVPSLNDKTWYYVTTSMQARAYYRTQTSDRTVIAFNFDETETVSEVVTYGMEDGNIINFAERETPTKGKELSILEQLVGNVGQVSTPGEGGGPSGP